MRPEKLEFMVTGCEKVGREALRSWRDSTEGMVVCVGEAGEGRVIVVDGGGSLRRALLGDMLAEQAASNGWAGLIIYGVIRDVDEIGQTQLGVQALGTTPLKTEKLGMGQRDVSVSMGGVIINPGDFIYADNNGVIVSEKPLL